jgi:hypothetical protein
LTLLVKSNMLTEKQRQMRETAWALGATALFLTGLSLAIVGGLASATVTFGIGLGICVSLSVVGIIIRERNLVS